MEQGVRTDLGHGTSPVSYRHNFLVNICFFAKAFYIILSDLLVIC